MQPDSRRQPAVALPVLRRSQPRRFRILMLTAEPPSALARGGRPQATHATLMGLSRRHAITLVTQAGGDPADTGAIEAWRAAGVEVRVAWWPRPRGVGLLARRARLVLDWLALGWPWTNLLYRSDEIQALIDGRLAAANYDAILVEDNVMAGYSLDRRIPSVLTEHEVRRPRRFAWRRVVATGSPRQALREADWQRWRSYQRSAWQRFDRIQCVTVEDAQFAAEVLPSVAPRIRVNPLGIELPPEPATALEDANTLLFVGGMSHPPNVDAAIWLGTEIMPLVHQRWPGARLEIVGHSPPPAVLALASTDIIVTGAVASVEPYLARASVVVAPLRIGGGIRMKVLQAMAHGKAVVTTSRGGRGIGRPDQPPPIELADEAAAFAAACATLLGDSERRHALGRLARRYVAEWHSPEAHVERLQATFDELLADRVSEH